MPQNTSKNSSILQSLRRVIQLEAEALEKTLGAINGDYAQAVQAIARCKGKVIVTGMGKSGLIAQKVAATFSSTGTPALYLHPAEAMHGDLGMVGPQDLVLAIGKSGESAELAGILPALKKLGARIIAITANSTSTLAKSAHQVLLLPIEKEACPLNLSPTCSTTAALAVGDALAIALMDLRKFRKEHFALLHPGGQLGKRLTLTVDDVMRSGPDNPVISLNANSSQMLVEITRKHAGAISIVNGNGRLAGLVTDYDIRKAVEKHGRLVNLPISDIMNPHPATILAGSLAVEAVEIMAQRKNPFSVLPVVDKKNRPVGMIQIHDLRAQGL